MTVKRKLREEQLLGNRVDSLLRSMGADKVARLIEKVGRRPCGCGGRRDALNRWHLKMLGAIDEMEDDKPKDTK